MKPWKEENLSFELSGKVVWVAEKGISVNSDSDAYKLSLDGTGDVVAIIDDKKFKLKLKTAEAQLKAAEAKYEALKIEIDEVIKQQLQALKAKYENSEKELARFEKLSKDKIVSQKVLDQAEADYKISLAKYKELQALETVREADLKVAKTKIEELQQTVDNAALDLKKTVLRSPYHGKLSEVYVSVGTYVQPGQKVANLVAMDPITVRIDVSPELDRKFSYGDFVKVFPADSNKFFLAMVNRKAVSADPRTHTYELELMLHNRQIKEQDINDHNKSSFVKNVDHLWPVVEIINKGQKEQALFSNCIYGEKGGEFVWKAEHVKNKGQDYSLYKLKKIDMEFYPEVHSILGVYGYKILKKPYKGKRFDMFVAGVPQNAKDGEIVTICRNRWIFQPEDLVSVILTADDNKSGFYIDNDSICTDNFSYWVYKAIMNNNGTYTVKKVTVKVDGTFNNYVMVSSHDIEKGDLIVDNGAQFITDGEVVNVKNINMVTL